MALWCRIGTTLPNHKRMDFLIVNLLLFNNKWKRIEVNLPVDDIFLLLICSIFLEIKGLINLTINAVLKFLGKTQEKIRKTFKVKDPKWTPEELQKLMEFVSQRKKDFP